MARTEKQKQKLLYLRRILLEKTDDDHSLTMNEILESLNAYGIYAERKSIYADIEVLREYGMDIIGEKRNRAYYYHVGSRDFELAELKLLVDSVQSAKFMTSKKTEELIEKIEGLASKYEASKLQRQVYVAGRIKADNESIFYNVDKLHEAIGKNVKVKFQYFQWNVKKERELRRDGRVYCISPWALSWDDENYYLVGYDDELEQIKHYRVDKMLQLELSEERRKGEKQFQKFDMAAYAKQVFGMFHGQEESVKIRFANQFAGVVIDRFGSDVTLRPDGTEHFVVRVKVSVSEQFLTWLIALGEGVEILGPESVRQRMREIGQRVLRVYS